ncbi:MAG TPA: lysylphosphatidylglycerol synthase domain-containing protein, partial [Anaerolineaceae bacterium]|nr:lysylphosphatidylglycerol synthase domain-containing protein [Anaerolineaceae bacterium]
MRKFLIAVVLLLGIYFVISRFTEVQTIADTFSRGDWRFLLLALIVELAWLVNIGSTFRAIYMLLGETNTRRYMIRLAAAANFVNVVAPAGGMTGIAVFLADARRRGYSSARATVAGALFVLFDYAATLLVVVIGLSVLFVRNSLHWPEIMASIILLLLAVFLTSMLVLAMRSARELGNVLEWLARRLNSVLRIFIHRDYLEVARAHSFAEEIAEGASVLRTHPKMLLRPFALAAFRGLRGFGFFDRFFLQGLQAQLD